MGTEHLKYQWAPQHTLEGLQESEQVGHMGIAYVPMAHFYLPSCRQNSSVGGTTQQNLSCCIQLPILLKRAIRTMIAVELVRLCHESVMALHGPKQTFLYQLFNLVILHMYTYGMVYDASCFDCLWYLIKECFQ